MKSILITIAAFLLTCNVLFGQSKPYNVVFDITSKDTVDHRMVLRWVSDIVDDFPNANVEIVFYGKSLDLVTQGKSMAAETVMNLTKKKNVSLSVCAIAMKRNNLDKSQLLAGVQTVPDGIHEIVMKQQDGWGYIKVSH